MTHLAAEAHLLGASTPSPSSFVFEARVDANNGCVAAIEPEGFPVDAPDELLEGDVGFPHNPEARSEATSGRLFVM